MKPIKTTYKNLRRYIGKEIYIEDISMLYEDWYRIGTLTGVEIDHSGIYNVIIVLKIDNSDPIDWWHLESEDKDILVWAHPKKLAEVKLEML